MNEAQHCINFRFNALILIDLYSQSIQEGFLKSKLFELNNKLSQQSSLQQFEITLCKILNVPYRKLNQILLADDPSLHLYFHAKLISGDNKKWKVCFIDPVLRQPSSYIQRDLGDSRILHIEILINESICKEDLKTIIESEGVQYGGRNFEFLGGEKNKKKFSNSANQNAYINLWYMATKLVESNILAFLNDAKYTKFKNFTIDEIRSRIGKIENKVMVASKINTRFKLGFSLTIPTVKIPNDKIFVIPDIRNAHGGVSGKIMTDGSGYISDTLARLIPYGICGGKELKNREKEMNLPSIVQIRLHCYQGLFKGCLTVTHDRKVCPEDAIVLRESMKKLDGPPHSNKQVACDLNVNNTFENPDGLESTVHPGASGLKYYAATNKYFVLLLVHLGVAKELIVQWMSVELERVTQVLTDRSAAYRLIHRELCRAYRIDDGKMPTADHNDKDNIIPEESEEDDDYDDTKALYHQPKKVKNIHFLDAEKALDFLRAGHNLDEPYLQKILLRIQTNSLSKLLQCRIRMENAIYLVGAPDPLGVLPEGCVFVGLPNDHQSNIHLVNPIHGKLSVPLGKIIVTRNPMHHPGDIRVLEAKDDVQLREFLQGTNAGVIFFSTKGLRSAADEMSGGDYDGDTFLILYGENELIPYIESVAPCDDTDLDATMPDALCNSMASAALSDRHVVRSSLSNLSLNSSRFINFNNIDYADHRDTSTARDALPAKFPISRGSEGFNPFRRLPESKENMSINIQSTSSSSFPTKVSAPSTSLNQTYRGNVLSSQIIKALIDEVSDASVGVYSNAWLAIADFDHPDHPDALAAVRYINDALDAPKTGKHIPKQSYILERANKLRPHFMVINGKTASSPNELNGKVTQKIFGTKSNCKHEVFRLIDNGVYKSTSIIGILYDMVQQSQLDIEMSHHKSQLHHPFGLDYLQKDEDLLSVPSLKFYLKDHAQNIELFQRLDMWNKYLIEYKKLFISENNQNLLKFDEIVKKYQKKFICCAKEMIGLTFQIKSIHHTRQSIEKLNEIKIKNEDDGQLILSCLVYSATYHQIRVHSNKEHKYPLSFCWEICGKQLHKNKFDSKKSNIFDIYLEEERKYEILAMSK